MSKIAIEKVKTNQTFTTEGKLKETYLATEDAHICSGNGACCDAESCKKYGSGNKKYKDSICLYVLHPKDDTYSCIHFTKGDKVEVP